MTIYCYVCPSCTTKVERFSPSAEGPPQTKCNCGEVMRRDYKTERPQTLIPAYMRAGASDKSDFLPSEKDFTSPSDPTGEKGMTEWKKTHVVKGSTWV